MTQLQAAYVSLEAIESRLQELDYKHEHTAREAREVEALEERQRDLQYEIVQCKRAA